ncbi:MAG: SprT family zinc-dependent metalloprotease [Bacteroidia bacterium]|nr:SprT family zinc-dependent metalloprotease [Bacteroidia bacterium]
MTLEILNENIPYQVEKKPGKTTSLHFIGNPLMLVIRTPSGVISKDVQAFIHQKNRWILRNYLAIKDLQAHRETFFQQLEQGYILYIGKSVPFRMVTGNVRSVKKMPEGEILITITPKDQKAALKSILLAAFKALAKKYLVQRTLDLAQKTQSHINLIQIKDVKSKWGSCSGKKNINLNWYLIFLPETLIDYVIIHELMHLREMNHGKNFWAWVKKYYPQYKKADAEIKRMSWVIGILSNDSGK